MIRIFKHIIKGYALWIWYYLYRPYRNKQKAEAQRRIEICEKCEHFESTRTCDLCGCFMDIKTKMPLDLDEEGFSIDGCYDRRW